MAGRAALLVTGDTRARPDTGTLIDGRYRLGRAVGTVLWQATDELLRRPVAVELFAPDSPRRHRIAAAIQAASRLEDPRLICIYDANDECDPPYVVTEWVEGTPLSRTLSAGPLTEDAAVEMVGEAAAALASAHRRGLAHLCLAPRMLIRSNAGMVKVRGVAIDAARTGTTAENPELADTHALGTLLYTGLTGHLPAPGQSCSPRRFRPSLGRELTAITSRALPRCGYAGQHAVPPLRTPAALARELSSLRPATSRPTWSLPTYDAGAPLASSAT